MAARSLEDAERPVHYFGFVLNEMESTLAHVRSNVYAAWDANLNLSPPRSRLRREEQSEQERPSLELLAWMGPSQYHPDLVLSIVPFRSDSKEGNSLPPEDCAGASHRG